MTEPRVVVAHREHLWWLLAEAAGMPATGKAFEMEAMYVVRSATVAAH
jgi:hypothetical protein